MLPNIQTMGTQKISVANQKQLQSFMRYLLNDIQALELMLERGMFEDDVIRIGAEQELCVVDKHWRPSPINLELLKTIDDKHFTPELAKFNIEVNMAPLVFEGACLSEMETSLLEHLKLARKSAGLFDSYILLTGILPTIRKFDMELDNLTPLDRYKALMKALSKARGGDYELKLRGVDELIFKHSSPMLEACNTSFQVHLQVKPDDFVRMYNFALALSAPVLAIATNSPMLFGKRLWSETRIALFQQSIDTRAATEHFRDRSPRVTFGTHWLRDSILEIYKEDIARFRVLVSSPDPVDSMEQLERGEIPRLRALEVHNSTVYRWNRACFGFTNGVPHLRIENRVLPAGPTPVDEMANTAFWLGLMTGMADQVEDITKHMEFDTARNNFIAASRQGLDTHFKWTDGSRYPASELIDKELIPLAKHGLELRKVDTADISKYLDIISARNQTGLTGAHWITDSYSDLIKAGTRDEVLTAITASTYKRQQKNLPVHNWDLATFKDIGSWDIASLIVEEFMTTDLFTVQKSDIIEFVADLMDWRRIRYLPVEDDKGKLNGLITSRILLRHCSKTNKNEDAKSITVGDIMIKDPITVHPEATITEAMNIMEQNGIGCLPVIKNGKLVGIITEQNFLGITRRLFMDLAMRR